MSCAGCDDCPTDRWHLHVTVQPHWNWTLDDVASALKRDIERHDIKPVVVTNHFYDNSRSSYRELIPTKNFKGTESDASREIFRMGILLNNAGWRVKRLKIEGDARNPDIARRALYFETHLKCEEWPAPMSTNAKGERIFTLRRAHIDDIKNEIECVRLMLTRRLDGSWCPPPDSIPHTIEATVLDTNPDLDKEWINQ